MDLSGPNQKRARRFKNQILCDLHFADVAMMESSDFMQQLRSFKPQVCRYLFRIQNVKSLKDVFKDFIFNVGKFYKYLPNLCIIFKKCCRVLISLNKSISYLPLTFFRALVVPLPEGRARRHLFSPCRHRHVQV